MGNLNVALCTLILCISLPLATGKPSPKHFAGDGGFLHAFCSAFCFRNSCRRGKFLPTAWGSVVIRMEVMAQVPLMAVASEVLRVQVAHRVMMKRFPDSHSFDHQLIALMNTCTASHLAVYVYDQ